MKNRVLSIVFGVSVFFLIITASISLPIYCRFFYFLHIKPLGLDTYGFSYEQIVTAYNQVLNFLTLPFTEFSAGDMLYSPEGAAHFYDCKVLFMINASVLIISAITTLTIFILHRKKVITLDKPKGFSIGFYSSISAIILPLIIGALACTDFERAFVIFHEIFFAGKDNWIFNYATDQIIMVLPQEFFMNCAIFIGAGLIIICSTIITVSVILRNKNKKALKNAQEEEKNKEI